jgi:hypothetical protein
MMADTSEERASALGAFGFAAMFTSSAYTPEDRDMVSAKFREIGEEILRLRSVLQEISERHIGDCPMALAYLSDLEWAKRCHAGLRATARDALR